MENEYDEDFMWRTSLCPMIHSGVCPNTKNEGNTGLKPGTDRETVQCNDCRLKEMMGVWGGPNGSCKTWKDVSNAYIKFFLKRLHEVTPVHALPDTWKQLRENVDYDLFVVDDNVSEEPRPPEGQPWEELIDSVMDVLRPEIEKALEGYESLAETFWNEESNV